MSEINIQNQIIGKVEDFVIERLDTRFTMDELASELHISKKTLYQHFHSKSELLSIVVERFISRMDKKIDAALAEGKSPLDKWLNLVRTVQSEHTTITALAGLYRDYPPLWERINTFRLSRLGIVQELIREAQELGQIRRDIDPKIAYLMFSNIVRHCITPSLIVDLDCSFEELIRQIYGIFMNGITIREK